MFEMDTSLTLVAVVDADADVVVMAALVLSWHLTYRTDYDESMCLLTEYRIVYGTRVLYD